MEKNVKLLGLINFFTDFRLYAPVAILYFSHISGSYMMGMMVFSVTGLATTFFELPTGILSDKMGRRRTLTVGAVAGTLSVALYAAAQSSTLLMAGAIFEGLSRALYSGNNSALLYDSLKAMGKEHEFHGYTGRVSSFFQMALALSALAGGLIAQHSMKLVLVVSVLFQAIIIPLSLFLTEPPAPEQSRDSSLVILKNALKIFREKGVLRRVALANLITSAGGEAGYQFQSAFIGTLWPVWAIGLARTLSNIGAALSFWFSGRIIDRFGELKMLVVAKIYGRLAYLAALLFPTAASPVLISSASLLFGVSSVASESFNNKHFSDRERATMGSVVSFAGSLLFAIYSPLLGWGADMLGPGKALLISQFIMAVPIVVIATEGRAAARECR